MLEMKYGTNTNEISYDLMSLNVSDDWMSIKSALVSAKVDTQWFFSVENLESVISCIVFWMNDLIV